MSSLDEAEVYVKDIDVIENPDDHPEFSYHQEEGHYGADVVVPWADAVDAGGYPCGYCCEIFWVEEVGGSVRRRSVEVWKDTIERLGVPRVEVEGQQRQISDYGHWWPSAEPEE